MNVAPKKAAARKPAAKAAQASTPAKKSAPVSKSPTKTAPAQKAVAAEAEAVVTEAVEATETVASDLKSETVKQAQTAKAAGASSIFEFPFSFSSFEMSESLMPEMTRDLAEKSIETVRSAYDSAVLSMEEQSAAIQKSMDSATASAKDLNHKMLEASKLDLERGFGFMTDMMMAKSLSEMIELQTGFVAQQFETITARSKEMQDAMTKGFEDSTSPVQDAAKKAVERLNAN